MVTSRRDCELVVQMENTSSKLKEHDSRVIKDHDVEGCSLVSTLITGRRISVNELRELHEVVVL